MEKETESNKIDAERAVYNFFHPFCIFLGASRNIFFLFKYAG